MISVTIAIIDNEGHIFTARRKQGIHLAGYWEFSGGKLEPGEREKQCLARELQDIQVPATLSLMQEKKSRFLNLPL